MIAEAWGIELDLNKNQKPAVQVAETISQNQLMEEQFHSMSEKLLKVIKTLVKAKGEIPWDQFSRKFGELREMGAGRRERERPDRTPTCVTEESVLQSAYRQGFF